MRSNHFEVSVCMCVCVYVCVCVCTVEKVVQAVEALLLECQSFADQWHSCQVRAMEVCQLVHMFYIIIHRGIAHVHLYAHNIAVTPSQSELQPPAQPALALAVHTLQLWQQLHCSGCRAGQGRPAAGTTAT